MSDQKISKVDRFLPPPSLPKRPWCSKCAVPMWLMRSDHQPDHHQIRYYYECVACEAKITVPA